MKTMNVRQQWNSCMRSLRRVVAVGALSLSAALLSSGDCQAQGSATYTSDSEPFVRFSQTTGTGAAGVQWTMFPDFDFGAFHLENAIGSPVTVESQALNNSLYVRFGGRIGINTDSPQRTLHIADKADGNAGILFENANNGQKWSVNGNPANFNISDNTNNKSPFVIEPNAPSHSIYVASNGNLGIGNGGGSVPLTSLHGYTQFGQFTFRMQEDSLTPGTWDISGGGVGFDIHDIEAGTNPFAILPGAPTNSLIVSSSGNIGLGTLSPSTKFHVLQSAQPATAESLIRFNVSDDAAARIDINNASSTDGVFIPRLQGRASSVNAALIMEGLIGTDTGTGPAIVYNAAKSAGGAVTTRPLVVYRNNNVPKVTVAANGNVTATAFINASSRDLKDEIADLNSAKASAALRQLNPVEFVYKDDPTRDPRVGFIAEDVPDLIAEPDRKSVPVMDVVALVTRVVKDQQLTIEEQKKALDTYQQTSAEQQKSIDTQRKTIDELMQRFADLEGRMKDSQK